MEKRTIQTHWNGKIKKLAGLIAGTLGEENRRIKRPEPHFGFGKYIRLYDDGRLEIDGKASEVDVLTLIDVLVERGAITVGEADSVADVAVEEIREAEEIEELTPEPTEESSPELTEELTLEPIEESAPEPRGINLRIGAIRTRASHTDRTRTRARASLAVRAHPRARAIYAVRTHPRIGRRTKPNHPLVRTALHHLLPTLIVYRHSTRQFGEAD